MLCNYCENKSACAKCNKVWNDQFIPAQRVRKYFAHNYVGVRGVHGYVWSFDTTNEELVPTHSIRIGNEYYCPYCGSRMYLIQDKITFSVTGYCCICEGAEAELKYEAEKEELLKKQEMELRALKESYKEKLTFCSEKLFQIKQEQEKKRFYGCYHNYNHFDTLNGRAYKEIESMI